MAAQSIVAPIGSVTLVANLFFAHYWLHEQLSRRDIAVRLLLETCRFSSCSSCAGNDSDYRGLDAVSRLWRSH